MKNTAFAIVLLFIVGCNGNSSSLNHEDHIEEESAMVIVAKSAFRRLGNTLINPEMQDIATQISVNGKLDVPPYGLMSMHATLEGQIKDFNLLLGSYVKKGKQICQIENPAFVQLQQDYWQAKANYKMLNSELYRQNAMLTESATALKNVQQADNALSLEKIKIASIEAQFEIYGVDLAALKENKISSSLPIVAKLNGIITQININNGKWVKTGDLLVEIADTDHLHAELAVFEKDLNKITVGQPIDIKLPDGRQFQAHIHLLGGIVDADRILRVHAHFDNDPQGLIPGTFCTANISIDKKNHLCLPQSAVVQVQNSYFAYHLVDSTDQNYVFEQVPVVGESNFKNQFFAMPNDSKNQFFAQNAFLLLGKQKNTSHEH